MTTKTLDCEKLKKQFVTIDRDQIEQFEKGILNGRNMMILATVTSYILEHKERFIEETDGAFCDNCWDVLEQMNDEYIQMVEHFSQHITN